MGLRFRKSFKIAPGVRLNVGRKSAGISLGTKGARVSINTKGRKTTTVGIPGTGVSYSSSTNITTKSKRSVQKKNQGTINKRISNKQTADSLNSQIKCNLKRPPSKWYIFWGIIFFIAGVSYLPKDFATAIITMLIGIFILHVWRKGKMKSDKYASTETWLEWQHLVLPESTSTLLMSREQLVESSIVIIRDRLRIINDCIKIITTTTNADTFFERLTLLKENYSYLKQFEKYLTFSIDYVAPYLNDEETLTRKLIDSMWEKTVAKARTLKTETGRNNQYIKFKETIEKHEPQMSLSNIRYYQSKLI